MTDPRLGHHQRERAARTGIKGHWPLRRKVYLYGTLDPSPTVLSIRTRAFRANRGRTPSRPDEVIEPFVRRRPGITIPKFTVMCVDSQARKSRAFGRCRAGGPPFAAPSNGMATANPITPDTNALGGTMIRATAEDSDLT